MLSPAISVVFPVYNAEKYIAEAVQSILDQTFTDFELIIINDSSTDDTLQVLQSFHDKRIRLVNNESNQKVVRCLNKGLALATGKFIARMDADDISLPQRFQKQVKYLNQHTDVDICATWVTVFGDKNYPHFSAESHDAIKAALLFHNILIHPSVMFRKAGLARHSIHYDEAFVNAEDYGMWAEVMDKLKFGVVPECLVRYRIHGSNVSVHKESNWEVIKKMNYAVYTKLLHRTGVQFTNNDLSMHMIIGFGLAENLSPLEYSHYLHWLEKIIVANRRTKYFQTGNLFNEVLEHIILLSRKVKRTPHVFYSMFKTFLKIFSLRDFITYLSFKRNKTAVFNELNANFNQIQTAQ